MVKGKKRKGYRNFMKLTPFVLVDKNGIVGSTRANSAAEAREIFNRNGFKGAAVFRNGK